MSWRNVALSLALLTVCTAAAGQIGSYVKLNLVCSPTNDLYRLLIAAGQPVERFETAEQAVQALNEGSSLFILADKYPHKTVELSENLIDKMSGKKMSVYAEFISFWPYGAGDYSLETGKREALNMRAVVTKKNLHPGLKPNTLLALHKCTVLPLPFYPPILAVGEIPGYNSVSGDLPKWQHPRGTRNKYYTLLGKSPLGNFVLAGTKLSHLVMGRYEPNEEWRLVWEGIIKLVTGEDIKLPPVPSVIKPSFTKEEALPENCQSEALRKAAEWYFQSGVLVQAESPFGTQGELEPWTGANAESGDGTLGVFEGFASAVDPSGYNMLNTAVKKDTAAESAMALALAGKSLNDARKQEVAANLLRFFFKSADSAKTDGAGAAGAAVIAAAAAASVLNNPAGNDELAESVASVLSGAGESSCPGESAGLWACALWAYSKTGDTALLDRAKKGIAAAMESYEAEPGGWPREIQQERARMLLPLAWLVRVEDEQQHRDWLKRIAEDLLALQDESGAIREALAPEPENDDGKAASLKKTQDRSVLIAENGDKAADFLYTINFAFLGLHEALKATGDSCYKDATDRLADFICRAQTKSILHPELNGSWFRGFDYGNWRYWGGDVSPRLGVWSVSAGPTQAWLSGVLAMRELDTSLWDVLATVDLKGGAQNLPQPSTEKQKSK